MQLHGLLDYLPIWALFVATLVVALLSFEGGFWVGRRRSLRSEQEQEIVVRGLVGGMLGLEAFMLAFTFGAAAAHFDARRQAVIDEANTIRTAYLRADFLPEPHRAEIRNLLREYVGRSIGGSSVGEDRTSDCAVGRVAQSTLVSGGRLKRKDSKPGFRRTIHSVAERNLRPTLETGDNGAGVPYPKYHLDCAIRDHRARRGVNWLPLRIDRKEQAARSSGNNPGLFGGHIIDRGS